MIFVLKPEVAAVIGGQRAQTVNDAMRVLTDLQLEGAAAAAKLDLQRELFELRPTNKEEMEP